MAREIEPDRPGTRAPRGCLVALGLGVLLLLALVVVVAVTLSPMRGR